MDIIERPCGCVIYVYGGNKLCASHDVMAGDPRCTHRNGFVDTLTVWPGETGEKLTATCVDCGYVRGRA